VDLVFFYQREIVFPACIEQIVNRKENAELHSVIINYSRQIDIDTSLLRSIIH